jgi:hypothetical protein
MRDGILSVSDGPAVNADALLTGYFLIEVESFDTADLCQSTTRTDGPACGNDTRMMRQDAGCKHHFLLS